MRPPCRTKRQEVIQDNAGPFDAIGVQQAVRPGFMPCIQSQASNQSPEETRHVDNRYGHFGLAEEVAYQLRRIVAPRVLEIDEADRFFRNQCVVKAEIRWGNAL